jgi:8-oxo-dGTP diphosphatase
MIDGIRCVRRRKIFQRESEVLDMSREEYKYCPQCGTELGKKTDHDVERPACANCGFVHYRNPAPAAGAVVFDSGRLLLVRRAHPPYVGKWTVPAGFIEWGESPEDTAVRELKEETNLDIELQGLFHVYAGHDDPRTKAVLVLYFGDIVGGEVRAGDDASEAEWFSLGELPSDDEVAFESHRRALSKLRREFPERFEK